MVPGIQGQDTATGYFSLLNPGRRPVHISVTFQAASSDTVEIKKLTPKIVSAGAAKRVGVTFSGLEDLDAAANGQLVVMGGASPVAQAVEIDPAPPSSTWSEAIIGGSLLLSAMFALRVATNNRSRLGESAPGAEWNFSSSWATTLTAVGAVFATVLASATLPPFPQQINKPTLINLNLLFGGLVVLGPFLYQALRKRTPSPEDQKAGRAGTKSTLLIACWITLWAVLGQLSAAGLLAWELVGGGVVGWVIVGAAVLVGFLAARYFLLTTGDLVARDWSQPSAPAPPQELDVRAFDRLDVRAAVPTVTLTEKPDEDSAELIIHPPAEQAPSRWSLL